MATENLKPEPKLCYSKPDLRTAKRISLMKYIEQRWDVPRGKSKASPGYPKDGPYTGDLRTPEECINFIWAKYQEEGTAGTTQLSKTAPRAESPPVEEESAPPVEVVKEEKKEAPVEKAEEEPKPKKTSNKLTVSAPATGITLPEIEDTVIAALTPLSEILGERLDQIEGKINTIESVLQVLADQHKSLLDIHKSVLLLVASAEAKIDGDESPIKEGDAPQLLSDALDVLTNATVLKRLTASSPPTRKTRKTKAKAQPKAELEEETVPEEEPEEEPEKVVDKPEEKSTPKPRSKRKTASATEEFTVDIDGEEHTYRLGDLANAKKFPRTMLVKIAAAIGAGELRPEQDRVLIAQLLIDMIQKKQSSGEM